MTVKKLALAGTAAIACSFGAATQAMTDLATCVSAEVTEFDGTVVDAALATPELSTLVDAVVAADLVDALNDADGITVYAPTNAAFAAVPEDVFNSVVADIDLLTGLLAYHVTATMEDPRRYVTPIRRETLAGPYIFYHRYGGEARVNQAAVNCAGVKASNGMVWLIDSVLIPQF